MAVDKANLAGRLIKQPAGAAAELRRGSRGVDRVDRIAGQWGIRDPERDYPAGSGRTEEVLSRFSSRFPP